ncbi:2Fe-2S iron-sulfur cluster-binding protein [Halococcus dombrowskii]|uniref:2Fe-2S iron-sulfur cluster-binding protein n=1 Tax=Halococcus dombrowskii TaxID=179637 RepID=A0AAV3SC01_HALDO|nr:2Fe-2S iron-sulfur cluster-binding protein [Halococcus dombrowskii]UOO94377.1 2Fe-2S iron-sulfur cluster-binding protein [Halococcus dombrowskii]
MVEAFGLSIGVLLVLMTVVLHLSSGTERPIPDDVSQSVLERRAESVPETNFPEPMNRSIGGGGAPAGAIGGEGGAEGELAEGEESEESESPAAIPDDEAEVYEIEYEKEGETLDVPENQTLLEAGEEQGWDLPYACREGQCLSCGGHVADGPSEDYLTHDGQEMLSEDEVGDGYTLTCVAYPTADMTLETNETP